MLYDYYIVCLSGIWTNAWNSQKSTSTRKPKVKSLAYKRILTYLIVNRKLARPKNHLTSLYKLPDNV